MIKTLLLISLCTLLYGGQKNLYLGVGLGVGDSTYKLSAVDTFTYDPGYYYHADAIIANVSLGYILSKKYRLEASYASISMSADDFFGDSPSDIGLNDSWGITGYDLDIFYTAWSMSFRNKSVDFVVTLGQGFYSSEISASTTANSGRATNYGIGALYTKSDEVEIEFSFKIKDITWEDISVSGKLYSPTDSISLFYLGAKYKF